MGPVAVHSSLQREPEPGCRAPVDRMMMLDSALRRNHVQEIMLCPDSFEQWL